MTPAQPHESAGADERLWIFPAYETLRDRERAMWVERDRLSSRLDYAVALLLEIENLAEAPLPGWVVDRVEKFLMGIASTRTCSNAEVSSSDQPAPTLGQEHEPEADRG